MHKREAMKAFEELYDAVQDFMTVIEIRIYTKDLSRRELEWKNKGNRRIYLGEEKP